MFHRYLSAQWPDGPVPGAFFGSDLFQNFARVLDEWAATDPGQLDYFGGRSLTTLSTDNRSWPFSVTAASAGDLFFG